ncbi:OLC1v1039222C1 [Oldenlandia corymbosa var. corymbosa]|uniref:OLC1v1039222C1 n=1 Tax=Oldenlandia corymbosa var. corymbosa TaxID=529605 RepID=A0AAV1D4P0_OLDCO|nr:OLC1v1039222C1 [Oldenlandia corymbosa var. corymbosa]
MYNSIWQAKVGVEVVNARNLSSKDGKGLANAFVELSLDGQKIRTTVKENDLNPCWNETFYFNIYYPDEIPKQTLEAHVYSYNNKNGKSKSSLGKACVPGTAFVPYSDAPVSHYPLERGSLFSSSSGELGLKLYIIRSQAYEMVSGLTRNNTVDYRPGGSRYSTQSRERYGQFPNGQNHHFAKDLIRSNTVGHRPDGSGYSTQSLNGYEQVPDLTSFAIPRKKNYHLAKNPIRGNTNTVVYRPGGSLQSGMNNEAGQKTAESRAQRLVRSYSHSTVHTELELEETTPAQPKRFLYVQVVRARDLRGMDVNQTLDPYVEVKVGDYRGVTNHVEKCLNPEWNAVFALSEERISQSAAVEVVVMDKDFTKDEFVGMVWLDLHEIPSQVPPYSPIDPEWYHLKSKSGRNRKGKLMLAVWKGTEADEAYADAMAFQRVIL